MSIIFKCSACGQYLSVPNKYAGRKLQCLICEAIVSVPIPSEETSNNSISNNSIPKDSQNEQ